MPSRTSSQRKTQSQLRLPLVVLGLAALCGLGIVGVSRTNEENFDALDQNKDGVVSWLWITGAVDEAQQKGPNAAAKEEAQSKNAVIGKIKHVFGLLDWQLGNIWGMTTPDWAVCRETVVIPDGVVEVTARAFGGDWWGACQKLQSVTIPDTVRTIGTAAFSGCTNLRSVNIKNGVKTIGNRAFASTGLESVTLPDSVVTLGSSAFKNAGSLTVVRMGKGMKTSGWWPFSGTNVGAIVVPDGGGLPTSVVEPNEFGVAKLFDRFWWIKQAAVVESTEFDSLPGGNLQDKVKVAMGRCAQAKSAADARATAKEAAAEAKSAGEAHAAAMKSADLAKAAVENLITKVKVLAEKAATEAKSVVSVNEEAAAAAQAMASVKKAAHSLEEKAEKAGRKARSAAEKAAAHAKAATEAQTAAETAANEAKAATTEKAAADAKAISAAQAVAAKAKAGAAASEADTAAKAQTAAEKAAEEAKGAAEQAASEAKAAAQKIKAFRKAWPTGAPVTYEECSTSTLFSSCEDWYDKTIPLDLQYAERWDYIGKILSQDPVTNTIEVEFPIKTVTFDVAKHKLYTCDGDEAQSMLADYNSGTRWSEIRSKSKAPLPCRLYGKGWGEDSAIPTKEAEEQEVRKRGSPDRSIGEDEIGEYQMEKLLAYKTKWCNEELTGFGWDYASEMSNYNKVRCRDIRSERDKFAYTDYGTRRLGAMFWCGYSRCQTVLESYAGAKRIGADEEQMKQKKQSVEAQDNQCQKDAWAFYERCYHILVLKTLEKPRGWFRL